jgi:hypothetical protein
MQLLLAIYPATHQVLVVDLLVLLLAIYRSSRDMFDWFPACVSGDGAGLSIDLKSQ